MIDAGKYVYCIIEEPNERNFGSIGIGMRGDAVHTIGFRDLACVVSSTPMTKYVIDRENMTAHERVIENVMADYTVLPARFCTIATSVEEVRNLLSMRYHEFKNLLRSMDNMVELGLKVFWKNMSSIFDEIAASDEDIQRWKSSVGEKVKFPTLEESSEIGKKVKGLLDRKRQKQGEEFIDILRPLCSGIKIKDCIDDNMVLNAIFLVDNMRELEFDNRIESLSESYADSMEFKYVGPAPPFHFVNLEIPWEETE